MFGTGPPLLALNFNAYQVLSSDSNLSIRSSTDATTNLYFEKIFTVNSADTSISINYIMKNTNKLAESWAPWEITRVKASGLTFFAIGSGSVTGNMASNTKVLNNSGWYNQDSTTVPTNGTYKFFCDGKGWIAHKTDSRYLFIKKFPDISKTSPAPGEAEVECYTASDNYYTEIENQGAYTSIPGGDSISWQVKWYIRKLPEDIIGVSGEQKLLDFVNKTINPNTTSIVKEQVIGDLFEVYPNPAIQKLTIINNVEPFKNAVVSIYDLQGQLIFKVNLMKSQSDIDLSKLNNGPYLLEISGDNNQKLFSRIIVKS